VFLLVCERASGVEQVVDSEGVESSHEFQTEKKQSGLRLCHTPTRCYLSLCRPDGLEFVSSTSDPYPLAASR
jgi:hypothetical protein